MTRAPGHPRTCNEDGDGDDDGDDDDDDGDDHVSHDDDWNMYLRNEYL